MTPTEMEEAIRNLQLQWTRIEQFLPNLATRAELVATRADLVATRAELVAQIQDAKRHAVILNEARRDQIKLLAENLARVEARMVTRGDLDAMATKRDLEDAIGALERTFSAQISQLASQIARLGRRRKK